MLLPLCALVACESPPQGAVAPQPTHAIALEGTPARMGSHGMLVFGREHVFLSHLPALTAPHDLQLVLEVERFAGLDDDPAGLFSLSPKRFSLDELASGKLTQFHATLHRDNFEAGGAEVSPDVVVNVKRVVLSGPVASAHDVPQEYLLVGSKDSAYLVHLVETGPYDQIVVSRVIEGATDAELGKGLRVRKQSFDGDRSQLATSGPERLRRVGADKDAIVLVVIQKHLSCLAAPDFAHPCQQRGAHTVRLRSRASARDLAPCPPSRSAAWRDPSARARPRTRRTPRSCRRSTRAPLPALRPRAGASTC
jgi:hypothetical protein